MFNAAFFAATEYEKCIIQSIGEAERERDLFFIFFITII